MTDTLQVVAASLMGVLGAGVAVLALGIREGADIQFVVGYGFGIATVGLLISVGMLGWLFLSDDVGDSLYVYPATMASSSALLFVSVDSASTGGGNATLPLTLVAAALLIVVGLLLVFVDQLHARRA